MSFRTWTKILPWFVIKKLAKKYNHDYARLKVGDTVSEVYIFYTDSEEQEGYFCTAKSELLKKKAKLERELKFIEQDIETSEYKNREKQ